MPRKTVPFTKGFQVHINARAHNREAFNLPIKEVWNILEVYLTLVRIIFDLKIYSFVLMPNHFHLIVEPTENNLGAALNYLMRETSKEIGRRSGRINQVWGGRCYKTVITSGRHFEIAYKYVYRNPVKAKLCQKVEDYPFTTLSCLMGKFKFLLPLEEDTLLFNPNFDEKTLIWLNRKPLERHQKEVSLAMRRRIFEFAKGDNSKVICDLEDEF